MNLTGVLSNNSIYTTTSMPVQASERTQPKIPKSKTTFKLVLEVFCAWQAYVKQRRARKTEKKRLLTLIIRAINFNEHTLMIKSMRGFTLAKKINSPVAPTARDSVEKMVILGRRLLQIQIHSSNTF